MRNFVITTELFKDILPDSFEKSDVLTILYNNNQSLPVNMITVFAGIKAKINLIEMPSDESESNAGIIFMAGYLYAQAALKNDSLCFVGDFFKSIASIKLQDDRGMSTNIKCFSSMQEAMKKLKTTANAKNAAPVQRKPRRKKAEIESETPVADTSCSAAPPKTENVKKDSQTPGSSLENQIRTFKEILSKNVHDQTVLSIINSKCSMILQAVKSSKDLSGLELQLKFNLGADDAAFLYPVFSVEKYKTLKAITVD